MAMNSISLKLFLALFGLTALVLLAGLGLARWSLDHSFDDYLSSIQGQRLDVIAEQLTLHYADNGGEWNSSTNEVFRALLDPRALEITRGGSIYSRQDPAFQVLQNQSLEDDLAQLAYLDQIITSSQFNDFPPPMGGMGPPMGPPMGPSPVIQPVSTLRDYTIDPNIEKEPPILVEGSTTSVALGDEPAQLPTSGRSPRVTPTVLVDVSGSELARAGNFIANASFVTKPIEINNVVVGELRAMAIPEFNSLNENAFFAQQQLASIAIIFGSLLLTAIASWFLSRMMLAPVVKIKNSIAELASGEYQIDLEINRKDELGLLMSDVNKLGSRLEKNRLSRLNFIADISHELRTPVTILGGEIDAIKDGMRELDMKSVESLGHETNRLKHLIEDLYQLSLSDIGGLRYEFNKLDIVDLLSATINQQRTQIDNAGLEVEFSEKSGCIVMADEQRLLQLFTNLLNNSIAYTNKLGCIRVAVELDESQVVVLFEDSSPSIKHEDMSVIFEPLFRAEESRDRRAGGAGLGLTICRNIVLAHDGTIEASPSKLGGVLFKIRLPAVK